MIQILKLKSFNNHNEGKETSILNGAILIITDKNSVEDLVNVIKNKLENN